MNTNFRYLTNLESSFRLVRLVAIGAIVLSLAFAAVVAFWALDTVEKSREKIYVLDNGKSLTLALAQDMNVNRSAEAKDHVRAFHRLFFNLDPDETAIDNHIREAAYYGDASIMRLYTDLREKGYFTHLIQGNVILKVEIDSVALSGSQSPFSVRTYARQLLVRANTITTRRLVTECNLIDIDRSDNNSHGFMIERLKVLENRDLETINRD